MSRWFGTPDRGRHVQVSWSRRVRADREQAQRVLFAFLAVNVGVFVLWTQARGAGLTSFMAANFLASAESVVHLRLWTLLTACFSHMDVWHLVFNMLALWVFGRDVGQALGSRALVHLYLVGGVVSMFAHAAFGLLTGDPGLPALGASGSVMAIAVLFGALFPNRTLLINFFIPVPAAVAVALYILLDLFGVFGGMGSGVAHAAHLGGAAYGLFYWWVWVRRRGR